MDVSILSQRPYQGRSIGRHQFYGDRFIPNRSAMDLDMARYLLMDSKKEEENTGVASPSKSAYRKHLEEALMMNRTRILNFNGSPPTPVKTIYQDTISDVQQVKTLKPNRRIPKSAERTVKIPGIVDDFYLNLLDWSSRNTIAVALGNKVRLWNGSNGSNSELLNVGDENCLITSVSWAPNGHHIAVGMDSSIIEVWDATTNKKLKTLEDGHDSRVSALCWNNQILTSGGLDGMVFDNDLRIRSNIIHAYSGHEGEVCGLKWSSSGQQLASGGTDSLLCIWDQSMASSNSPTLWQHRFEAHEGTIKAIAWCPFQRNLLASGGGSLDRRIKFWNTQTGACLNSINTGSQVCSLLWSKNEKELLSSHGFWNNQLILWKYPSMDKMAELAGHTSRVLFTAQSPDGCKVASASADRTMKIWNIFREDKPAHKPFSNVSYIR